MVNKELPDSYSGGSVTMPNLRWIREGATGCVFSQVVAARTENGSFKWGYHIVHDETDGIVDTPKGKLIIDKTIEALYSREYGLFSIIFPSITSTESLTRLIHYLSKNPPYFVKQIDQGIVVPDDTVQYYGIHLRINMQDGKESWPMVLGPYDYFSPTRRAPVTELIFRNSVIKGDPTTPETQIGIADSVLGLKEKTYTTIYDKTVEKAAINRQGYSKKMYRARIAVVVPKDSWDMLEANSAARKR